MIESLHIENVAVVKSLDIEFNAGMTALTGETGAGKSIIIDSLNLLLGARADKELLRNGESRAEVSALFTQLRDDVVARIEELGFEAPDGSVMISRSLSQSGSGARINGRPITLALLREISTMLFGIHGQNDNMLLLEPKNHIAILDSYADNRADNEKYAESFSDFYPMLSDKLFDQKCAEYADNVTVISDVTLPKISEVSSNKLY